MPLRAVLTLYFLTPNTATNGTSLSLRLKWRLVVILPFVIVLLVSETILPIRLHVLGSSLVVERVEPVRAQ